MTISNKNISLAVLVSLIIALVLSLFLASGVAHAKKFKELHVAPIAADDVSVKTVKKSFQNADFHKGLKVYKKILIGNYRVAYHVAKSSYVKEQGGQTSSTMNGWTTTTTYKDQELRASAFLQGVNSEDLNNITEKAYQDLISRLKAAGREVITMDQIKDSEVIANELKTAKLDENGEYWTNFGIGSSRTLTTVTWPDNTPLWFMMGDTLDVGAGLKAAGNALKMKNFGFSKQISTEQKAALLDISVTIRFADTWSQTARTVRKAKVRVIPGMRMGLNKVGISTSQKTPFGHVPGPSGDLRMPKKIPGFLLGSGFDWAENGTDSDKDEGWTSVGQTIELTVTTTPEDMEKAVMEGLTSLNASIAALAEKHKGKK